MKILIGGGGTGGHIYPALALARFALAADEGTEVLFVGSATGLESRIIPAAGFPLVSITARGYGRRLRQLGGFARDLGAGILQAGRVIRRFRPDVVLGTGGYVAAPLVLAAALKRRPTVIHEQNARPGLANRRLAPLVNLVCLSFAASAEFFPGRCRVKVTGNPRAAEVAVISREEGCRRLGLDPARPIVLVYGGSRGALAVNRVATAYLLAGLLPAGASLILVTGAGYFQEVQGALAAFSGRVKIFPYLEDMPAALAAADLAVTRCGATTLAELTARGLPAVLIPSPNVVENHQYHNARLLADAGAAVLIEETGLDHHRLGNEIGRLLGDQSLAAQMSERSRALAVPDAAARLYRSLQEVAS